MKYLVVTPCYESGGYYEPKEYGSDVVEVEAETKKEAKVKGLRELRRTRSQWLRDQGGNPFKGLKVEPQYTSETCPSHNVVAHAPDPYDVDGEDWYSCDTCGYGDE